MSIWVLVVHVVFILPEHLLVVCILILFGVNICQEMSTQSKFACCCSHGIFIALHTYSYHSTVQLWKSCSYPRSGNVTHNMIIDRYFIACFYFCNVMFCVHLSVHFAWSFTSVLFIHASKLTYFLPQFLHRPSSCTQVVLNWPFDTVLNKLFFISFIPLLRLYCHMFLEINWNKLW